MVKATSAAFAVLSALSLANAAEYTVSTATGVRVVQQQQQQQQYLVYGGSVLAAAAARLWSEASPRRAAYPQLVAVQQAVGR